METLKAIALRKSTRMFTDKLISDADLDTILAAACAAPVGHGEFKNLHLTVVRDADILQDIKDAAMNCFRDPIRDIFYGAPTVIVISTRHGSVPELDMANAGTIGQSMLLAATDLGIDSCYVWGIVPACRADPDLLDAIELPEGYEPLSSVALGYAVQPDNSEKPMTLDNISINRI